MSHVRFTVFGLSLLGCLFWVQAAQPSGEALGHYVLGLQHAQEGEIQQAIEELRTAWNLDPAAPDIAIELAGLLLRDHLAAEAAPVAEAAVAMAPDRAEAHWLLGQAYSLQSKSETALPFLRRAWELDREKHNYLATYLLALEAAQRFQEALDVLTPEKGGVEPTSPYLLMRRAGLRNRVGLRQEALDDFLAVLKLAPGFPDAAEYLVANCRSLGPSPTTATVLDQAVALVPGRADIRRELARVLILLNRQEEATPHLELLLTENPDDPGVLMQLGIIRFGQERLDEAIRHLRRARELDSRLPNSGEWLWKALTRADSVQASLDVADEMAAMLPDNPQAGWFRASSLAMLGRADESLEVLRHVHELDPNHRDARLLAALLLEEKGELTEARTQLEWILKTGQQDRQALFRMALLEERLGRVDVALEWFRRLLAAHPRDAIALNYAGYLCAEQGIELDQGLEWTSRAVGLEPENAAFVDSHGWVLYKLERHDEAVKYLEHARELDPEESEILIHLAKAYRAAGRIEEGRHLLRDLITENPEGREARELLQLWDKGTVNTGNSR